MITKYRTTKYHNNITQTEVLRETAKTVFLQRSGWRGKVQRAAKESELLCYFDTWEEAHEYLLNRATQKIKSAIKQKVSAEDELRRIQQMQPPA